MPICLCKHYLLIALIFRGGIAVIVDFNSPALTYRCRYGGGVGQALARAVGVGKYSLPLRVVDASAGSGQDAFVLASLGCQVIMLERNPEVFVALTKGLLQAQTIEHLMPIAARIQLINICATQYLHSISQPLPEVIYFDPMFPESKKSALVKKNMQVLRSIVGQDEDAPEVLEVALSKAKYRIVVKRPLHANYLSKTIPNHQIMGKKGRFDIYLPN